jgi:hypothetical protein
MTSMNTVSSPHSAFRADVNSYQFHVVLPRHGHAGASLSLVFEGQYLDGAAMNPGYLRVHWAEEKIALRFMSDP